MADIADAMGEALFATLAPEPGPDAQPPEAPQAQTPEAAPPPEPQPQPADTATPAPQPEPQRPPDVPLATYLDTREELKTAKARLAELERLQQPPEPVKVPDLYDSPEEYQQYIEQQVQQRLAAVEWGVIERLSTQTTVAAHGAETLEAAKAWAVENRQTRPYLGQMFKSQPDPFGWLVGEYQRDRLLKDLGSDPDAYVRRRFAELEPGSAPQPAATTPAPQPAQGPAATPQPSPPPRSLASLPGSGGAEHVPAGSLFGEVKFALDK